MRNAQFDAFGEPLSPLEMAAKAPQSRLSHVALRVGVGIFWTLVVGIVTARVAYFDPDFAKNFVAVATNLVHGVFSV